MKKKRLKKLAIAALAVIAVVSVIVGLNIEPADYGKTLSGQVNKAEKLLNSAKVGNDKGMYAEFTIESFKQQIEEAKTIAGEGYYEIQKKACDSLKEEMAGFKDAANADCLSAGDVKKILETSKVQIRTVEFNDYQKLEWYIDGQNLTKAEPINLEAKLKGPNYNTMNAYLEQNRIQGQVFSLYHNGEFPGKLGLSIGITHEGKNTAYLYGYNAEAGMLEYQSKVVISDDKAQVTVDRGGDYLILLNPIEGTVPDEAVQESGQPDGQPEQALGDDANTSEKQNPEAKGAPIAPSAGRTDTNTGHIAEEDYTYHCTLEIRCDTLSSDLSKLKNASLAKYVPSDGTILSKIQVEFNEGETVYDVLYRNCRNKDIHMSASYTPIYGSQYVEGINYLYEFDGGPQSGWMYKVNGWFPNYGCSKYKIKDGDEIVWAYTCEGLGKDIGSTTDLSKTE